MEEERDKYKEKERAYSDEGILKLDDDKRLMMTSN